MLPLLLLLGCGARCKCDEVATAPAESAPRIVTDLSQIAPRDSAKRFPVEPGAHQAETRPAPAAPGDSYSAQSNLNRQFAAAPGGPYLVGTEMAPGEGRLLNAKAARFVSFSRALLYQVFVAAHDLERRAMAPEALRADAGWVHVTAVMSKQGRLSELVVDRSSGSEAVDRLVLRACKEGLWAKDPPPSALSPDGTYRLQIQAQVLKPPNQERNGKLETRLGLALD